jgi:hypothetical protein
MSKFSGVFMEDFNQKFINSLANQLESMFVAPDDSSEGGLQNSARKSNLNIITDAAEDG